MLQLSAKYSIRTFRTGIRSLLGVMNSYHSFLILVFILNCFNLEAQETTLINNVNIVPMTREGVISNAAILIKGDEIVAIGRSGELVAGRSATIIDGKGQYVLPGLIEMHVHVREKETLDHYLEFGFTTIRTMNGRLGRPLEWREEIAAGELIAPDIIISSPTIIGNRHAAVIMRTYPYAIRTEAQARNFARQFKEDGYDLIKVFRLEKRPFFALIDEAKKVGIPVSGHLPDVNLDGDSISYADLSVAQIIQTGMGIEHLVEFTKAAFEDDQSEERIRYITRLLKENNTTIATLLGSDYRYHHLKHLKGEFLTDSLIAITRKYFGEEGIERLNAVIADDPAVDLSGNNDFAFVLSMLKRLNDDGVNIVIGTDSHDPINIAGLSSIQEIVFLTQAGISNFEAIKAATINGATTLGMAHQIGTIEVGKKANLVFYSENPLEKIGTLYQPQEVILRGGEIGTSTEN